MATKLTYSTQDDAAYHDWVYLDAAGQPIWLAGEKTFDTFCTKDMRLLMQIQPEYSRV